MKRAAATLFAAVPRRWRFRAALFCARFARGKGTTFDGPQETALHRILQLLTNHGVAFDPIVTWEGYDDFVRVCREGGGVLLVAPHAALGLLSVRDNHDAGLQPITITSHPMRIAGTALEAQTIQPSPTFLVTVRQRLREGRLVGAMLDRAEHHGERTVEFENGIIVAPALLKLAARCGARVAFVEAHVEDGRVAGKFAVASSNTEEGLTHEFERFVERRHPGGRCAGTLPAPAGSRRTGRLGAGAPLLLAVAALFHLTVSAAIFTIGRLHLSPAVNRDGIVVALADSLLYQQQAITHDPAAPPHVRLLSLSFALFGHTTLAAEPMNLLLYLIIVALTFSIAKEAGGERAGLVAAAAVAIWPTFVIHTTQFLKDPLFIAGALAVVLVVIRSLTRTYDWRGAAGAGAVLIGAAVVVLLMRPKFAVVVVALTFLALLLLVARQIAGKRLLRWNLVGAVVALAVVTLIAARSARTYERVKTRAYASRGEAKSFAGSVPTAVVRGEPAVSPADRAALALGSLRARYVLGDAHAGSGIDDDVAFHDAHDLIAYLPRAAAVGLWAPFPNRWDERGQTTGRSGRLLAAAETAAMYVIELLAVVAVVLPPRRLPALLLVVTAAFGVTILGAAVTNVGTLYRFRYPFWILLIAAGVAGGAKLARLPAMVCIALLICGCTHPVHSDLVITNRTGWKLAAIYLSPTDAPTWEENLLGADSLGDGETLAVRFAPGVQAPRWDLRIDGVRHRAEWKGLERKTIASIDLRVAKDAVIAEVR